MPHYYTYDSNLRDRNKFTSTVDTTFGTKRYFSQLDTEVYFGAVQMDEIVAIDFTIAEPKLPIYGYNSFYPNRIVSGRRTVQGTFALNFTQHNCSTCGNTHLATTRLLDILNHIDDSVLANDYEALIYRCPEEDSTGLGIGNSAIFNKMFDITLSYGYGKTEGMQTYNSCFQTLVGVQIVDYRQALDTEGNPILDMYSFIAKDIRYMDGSSSGETNEETNSGTTEPPNNDIANEPKDPEYEVASYYDDTARGNLVSKCKNSTIPGYIVQPQFNYTPPGSVAASAYPYLRIAISSMNDSNTEFTNVSILIQDQKNGLNTTIPLSNIKNNNDHGTIHEFKDSTRDLGVDLRKLYTEVDGYKAQCTIKFTAKIEGKDMEISLSTNLEKGATTI
jgi:hypothetical protein